MKIVGTSYPIHDAENKVTGQAIYAGDMQLPKMLHMALLFSSIPHGMVTAIDASKALALPGVVQVLHCFNTTEKMFNRYRTVADQSGQSVLEQERVFNQHVRFVGDRVAGVVAETEEIARAAVKLIDVTYEELPFTTNPQEVLAGKLSTLHKEGAFCEDFHVEIGEKNQVAPNAVTTETTSHLARISHVTMETHACVASYDKGLGEATIWSPNQDVHGIRTVVADLFELPYHKVRVIKSTMGGSFGAKQEWVLEPVTLAASLKTGRPVKLVFNRSEAMVSSYSRSPMDAKISSQFTKEGKLQSFYVDVTLNAGAYLGNSYDYACAMVNKSFRCYKYPYMNYTSRAVCTNTPVSGAFRGWTSPELCIMLEHNLNMAARNLQIDPLELRLNNVAQPGDTDIRLNLPMGEVRTKECILLGREKFRWDERRREDAEFNKTNARFKRGTAIACGGHLNGYFPRNPDFAGVDMRMNESGGVHVNITLHDHGCGTVTAMQMIVAEALGIAVDQIYIKEGDTATTPFDFGCYSSRTTYVLGRAAKDCADKLLAALVTNIAEIHNIKEDKLLAGDGVILCQSDPSIRYTYGEAVIKSHRVLQREVAVLYQYRNKTNPGVTAAHFAQVEVDTYTGMSRVLNYLAVHDIGQAINHEICVGQVQGAVIMGSGAALSEHMTTNENGKSTNSLKDYHIINSFEAPNVEVAFIEDGMTEGPYGSKSIGEVAHVPVAAAVIGAVNEALQSELCHLPLNADTIVKLMQTRRNNA